MKTLHAALLIGGVVATGITVAVVASRSDGPTLDGPETGPAKPGKKTPADKKKKRQDKRDENKKKRADKKKKRQDKRDDRGKRDEPSVEPPPEGGKQRKVGQAGVLEVRNTGDSSYFQPQTHPNGEVRKQGQSLADWLTNVSYWTTYPNGPKKIDPKNPAHEIYVKAWLRMKGYIDRSLPNHGKLGTSPAAGVTQEQFQRFALRMIEVGPPHLVSAPQNNRAYMAGVDQWVRGQGSQWAKGALGKPLPNGETVTASGVHGVVFIHMATNSKLPPPANWNDEPHRGVLAVNKLY